MLDVWLCVQLNVDPLIDGPFALIFNHAHLSHLTGIGHVSTPVGLEVQIHDLDGAYLLDLRG